MRPRIVAFTAGVTAVLAAAPAAAQTTATVSVAPNRTNVATRLVLDAAGGSSATGIPQAITVLAARGFRFDRDAVAKLCEQSQAVQNQCPAESRIGGGTAEVRVDGPFPNALGAGTYQGTSAVFLAPVSEAGDLAGLVVQLTIVGQTITGTGRITPIAAGPFGIRIAFDPLPQSPQLPPGYTVTLQKLHSAIAARRTEQRTQTKRVRRRGRIVRKRVVRKIRHVLMRTPRTCSGSWPVQVLVRYPDRQDVLDTPIVCAR
jgi:hypothetical protein